MKILRVAAAFGLVGLLLGCLHRAARAQSPEWTLREELRIGGSASPSIELPRIARVTTGRDGKLYALTGGELLVFDRSGSLTSRTRLSTDSALKADLETTARSRLDRLREEGVHRFGSSGYTMRIRAGHQPAGLGWIGDTLWALASGMGHIALMGADGKVARRIPFSRDVGDEPGDAPLALLGDRSLLRTITHSLTPREEVIFRSPAEEGYRMPVIPGPPSRTESTDRGDRPDSGDRCFLMRTTLDGRVIQGLEIFTASQREVAVPNPQGRTLLIPVPFRDDPLVAATPDGSEIIYVERHRPTGPAEASYSVARFDVRTGKRASRHIGYTPAFVARPAVDSLIRSFVDTAGLANASVARFIEGFPSLAAARARILAALPLAAWHPPVTDLVAASDRTVWLREQATGRWMILGRDGAVLARVALPAGVRLLHVDAESAWAMTEDTARRRGNAQLIRYRIVRP